jgi:plastocyanin
MRTSIGLGVVWLGLVGGFVGSPRIASAQSTTTTSTGEPVRVQAGINDAKDTNIAVLEYMPSSVTVAVGATVTWDWTGAIEPHSVTFLAPGQRLPDPGSDPSLFVPRPASGAYDGSTLVNSGLQPLGPIPVRPFSMTFAKAGAYQYYCVIHPNMTGTVNVVAPGAKVDSPTQAAARGKAQQTRWLREGRAAKKKLLKAPIKKTKNPDGSTTWQVQMGASTQHSDVLAFSPTPRSVKAGDQVEFDNNSHAPHTATFNGNQPAIQSPLDPRTDTPIPGPSPQTLNLTDLFNSGTVPPDAAAGPGQPRPPVAARKFTFVVPRAGKYVYYCILHTLSDMGGEIDAR